MNYEDLIRGVASREEKHFLHAKAFQFAIALLTIFLSIANVHAQNNRVLVGLKDSGEVSWNASIGAWVAKPSTKPLVIADAELNITERVYSQGRDVVIAAQSLSFSGAGAVMSGYPTVAASGPSCGDRGGHGKHAGRIDVFAMTINSLKISAWGQSGGNGSVGCPGQDGLDSSVVSGNGGDAICNNNRSNTGGVDGFNSTQASGNGFKPALPSGNGGAAGNGGNGGKINVTYAFSSLLLNDPNYKNAHVRSGSQGKPGEPGPRGDGGSPGPSGSRGADRQCDCGCPSAACAKSDSCSQECTTCSLSGGAPGPIGSYGPKGDHGSVGAAGINGSNGAYEVALLSRSSLAEKLRNYLPDPAAEKIEKAETSFIANDREKAKKLAEEAVTLTSDAKIHERAGQIVTKINCGVNYYGRKIDASPIFFMEDGITPQNLQWVHERLQELEEVVKQAEGAVRLREDRTSTAQNLMTAYSIEISKLDEQTKEAEYGALASKTEADNLKKELDNLLNNYQQLINRLENLQNKLNQLSLPIQDIQKTIKSLEGAIMSFGVAGQQAYTGNYLGALAAFTTGLGQLSDASREADAFVKAMNDQAKSQLESLIHDVEQLLSTNNERSLEANNQLVMAALSENYQQSRISSLSQMKQDLDKYKNAQDLQSKQALLDISKEIYRSYRIEHAGKLIDQYRNYIDLVTALDDANSHTVPPSGDALVFDVAHVNKIRLNERDRTNMFSKSAAGRVEFKRVITLNRPVKSEEPVDAIGTIFNDIDKAVSKNGSTTFSFSIPEAHIKGADSRLAGARIMSLSLKLFDKDGVEYPDSFELSNPGSSKFRRQGTGRAYKIWPATAEMGKDTEAQQGRKFAFSSIADTFELTFFAPIKIKLIDKIVIEAKVEKHFDWIAPLAKPIGMTAIQSKIEDCNNNALRSMELKEKVDK